MLKFRFLGSCVVFLSSLPVDGMALYPFIILRSKGGVHFQRLLNHERIHLRQQAELLIIPFYIWYLMAYLFNRLKGMSHGTAYRSIIFEREAYKHDADPAYLANRPRWAFLRE